MAKAKKALKLPDTNAGIPGFPRADRFTKKLGIRYPIVQAVMGGFGMASLSAAVSEGGGLGDEFF